MACTFSEELLEAVISFHGHSCPGLAIGIRAAEYGLKELDNPVLSDLVCLTETDMCGVDGIQFLTKCTFGKGNLIHKDIGKAAFSFFDRRTEKSFRLLFRDVDRKNEKTANKLSREELIEKIMSAELEDIFELQRILFQPPRRARILQSLQCASCGEATMESRIRRIEGKHLCIPCFMEVEQKI